MWETFLEKSAFLHLTLRMDYTLYPRPAESLACTINNDVLVAFIVYIYVNTQTTHHWTKSKCVLYGRRRPRLEVGVVIIHCGEMHKNAEKQVPFRQDDRENY